MNEMEHGDPGWREEGSAPPSRPTSLTVIAILAWVFGGIGILYSPIGILSLYMPQPGGNPMVKVFEAVPWLKTYTIVATLCGVLASSALVVGGVGLWKLRRWGWTLCNGYGVYGLVAAVVGMAVNVLYMIPALQANIPTDTPQGQGAMIGGIVGGVCGSLFGLILPIAILIVINRGAAARAKAQST